MEFSEVTKQYWQEKDWEDVDKVQSIKELYSVAERIMERMPKPFGQVCGPITTGGAGSVPLNLERFNVAIKELQAKGVHVFDQMPFEKSMERLSSELTQKKIYDHSILSDFYLPLFESGKIKTFYFLPDWQSSTGAKWEHEKAKELGAEIVYL